MDGEPRIESMQHGSNNIAARSAVTSESHASSIEASLASAVALHGQGQHEEASRLYETVLAARGDHAEALHMYGVLRFQRGQIDEAEKLIRRSTEIEPAALPLANLGSIVAQQGRREEAVILLESALAIDPRSLHASVRLGNTLIELGRFEEALTIFDRTLEIAPLTMDALSNRGMALRALGRHEQARETYERALTVDPRSFETHANLGNVMRDLQRPSDALQCYDRALALQPSHARVLVARGRTLVDLERPQEALASFNEAIASQPDFVDALYNSAVALERLGRAEEALQRCTRVLALEPDHPHAHGARGSAYLHLKRYEEALSDYSRALEKDPGSASVLSNQGSTFRSMERFSEALASYQAALAADPALHQAWCNLGQVHQDLYHHEDALIAFDKALTLDPRHGPSWFERANSLFHLMRFDEALAAHETSIRLQPDRAEAHFAKGFVHLHQGDFARGWPEYEWRLRDEKTLRESRQFSQPRWTGEQPLAGKTILIHAEQGFGDTLQFCRYVDKLHGLGARVVLEVQPALKSLLSLRRDPAIVIAQGETLPEYDFHCPLLSLPLAFGTDWHDIPNRTPYVEVDIERERKWEQLLGPKTRKRVGIAWSGNPQHRNDRNRSIELSALLPLFDRDIQWVSLQKAVRARDWTTLEQTPLVDVEAQMLDFADTAALVQSLDLVISVDSAVAHLAGALNRPVWILLTHLAEWRWLDQRSDSPWYPSATLFRQSAPGQWGDVVQSVRNALIGIEPRDERSGVAHGATSSRSGQ